jgi:hypothetical protein
VSAEQLKGITNELSVAISRHLGLKGETFVTHEVVNHLVEEIQSCVCSVVSFDDESVLNLTQGPPVQTSNYSNERVVMGNSKKSVNGVRYVAKQVASNINLKWCLLFISKKWPNAMNYDFLELLTSYLTDETCASFTSLLLSFSILAFINVLLHI